MAWDDLRDMTWLTQDKNPGEYLAQGVQAGSTIAANFLRGAQMAEEKRQFDMLLPLKLQEAELRRKEGAARIIGEGFDNQMKELLLQNQTEAKAQFSDWLAQFNDYSQKEPVWSERPPERDVSTEPETKKPIPPALPTNPIARAKALPVLYEFTMAKAQGMQAEWSSKGWNNPEYKTQFHTFVAENPWLANTPWYKQVADNFETARKEAAWQKRAEIIHTKPVFGTGEIEEYESNGQKFLKTVNPTTGHIQLTPLTTRNKMSEVDSKQYTDEGRKAALALSAMNKAQATAQAANLDPKSDDVYRRNSIIYLDAVKAQRDILSRSRTPSTPSKKDVFTRTENSGTTKQPEIPQEHIDFLKEHPESAQSFDKRYGEGAAAAILER